MSNSQLIEIVDLLIGFDVSEKSEKLYPYINISASKGELIALVGRNGVGKSTFLRTVARLQPAISGEVKVLGNSFKSIESSQFSQIVSFIPAEPIHAANMTVFEFVKIARYPYHGWFGNITTRDKEMIHLAIESVNLTKFVQRELDSLSDGERQRAMIAFAIAQDSQVILMDEPTAFIDLPNKFEIVRLLKELASKGKTVIFSTHDLHTALREVDNIWLMLPNFMVSGSPEDLALNGSLNMLLEGSNVYLDLKTGGFISKNTGNRKINLKSGDDLYFEWTKHALERLGFTLTATESKEIPEVECLKKDNAWIWVYMYKEDTKQFESITSLSTYLRMVSDA